MPIADDTPMAAAWSASDNPDAIARGETPPVARLTADEILALDDTPGEEVYVKEWQTNIKVIGLTKRQQIDVRQAAMVDGAPDEEKVQQGIWLEGVVEPKWTPDKLAPLFEKNAGAVDTVLKRILSLSGMTEEAVKKQEATFRK